MALAQDPQGRVLYAHTVNRFEDLDLEFFSALQRAGLLAERVWAAPDRDGAGADASLGREALEGGAAFKAARALVERLSGGEELEVHFNDYVADGFS